MGSQTPSVASTASVASDTTAERRVLILDDSISEESDFHGTLTRLGAVWAVWALFIHI